MATPVNVVPLPIGDPIAKRREALRGNSLQDVIAHLRKTEQKVWITDVWAEAFTQQGQQIAQAPSRINSVELEDQSAAIGATDISGSVLASGYYRFSYYFRITVADGVSSSLAAKFDWVDKGVLSSHTFTAETGDTVTTNSSGSWVIRVDAASPIRYQTTYASNTPAKMHYDAVFILERLQAA